ncbi:MAG TPA: hypothetical protein VIK00_01420, partial [Candidatus Limnocylindrales bacterium]
MISKAGPAAQAAPPDEVQPVGRLPSAGSVLRVAIVGWGLGHVMLGDRRGWLLLILQPIAVAGVVLLALGLIDGTRWLIVFPPLVALLVFWIAQAVDAHQRAIKMGARAGGELAIVGLLPIALTVLTLFWLVGGRHGSPSATLQEYIGAWMDDRPEAAAPLFAAARTPDSVSAEWNAENQMLSQRVAAAEATYGEGSGLDADHPFDSLRFGDPEVSGDGRVAMKVEIVRDERIQTTVLGFIPTAGQQTVV